MSLGELTKAHIAFIQQIGKIEEKGNNPFHQSKYATLEGVLGAVNPVLAANGLVVSQTFDHEDGRTILKTHLRHVSGEEIISSALYPETTGKNKLHDFGGNCTYMRRYTLLAILGICAGIEDNDGNHLNTTAVTSNPKVNIPKQQSDAKTIPNPPVEPEYLNQFLHDLKDWADRKPTVLPALKHRYGQKYPDFKGSFQEHIQEPKQIEFILDFTNNLT